MNNKEVSGQPAPLRGTRPGQSAVRSQRKRILYLVLIILVGVALRAGFLVTPHIDSDQAIFGLQGRHILQGESPIFSWGTGYIGTLQSFLDAVAFYIFGSSRLVLNAVTTLLSVAFIIITYHLGKTLHNETTGFIGALFASVSPVYLTIHGAWARHGYMEALLFGSILFILSIKIGGLSGQTAGDVIKKERLYVLLGFVAGIAWWTNFLISFYFLPIAIYLIYRDRKLFLSRRPLLFVLAFIIGSLPFWIFNIKNSFGSLTMLGGAEGRFLENLSDYILYGITEIIGSRRKLSPFLSIAVELIYGLSFAFLIYRAFKDHRFLPLLLFIILFPLIFSASKFGSSMEGGGGTRRYLLPLYSVVPLVISVVISSLRERWRYLSIVLLLFILSLNLYRNVSDFFFLGGGYKRHQEMMLEEKRLFDFLKAEDLLYVSTYDYWVGPKLTFDSAEEIIFASPEGNRHPGYTEMINSAEKKAYLFVGGNGPLENTFKVVGYNYKKEVIGPYTVFYSIVPPKEDLRGVPSKNWKAYASQSVINVRNAFDRDISTRWNSEMPRQKGMWFMFDLGRGYPVYLISLHPGTFLFDSPDSFTVYTSDDRKSWKRAFEHKNFIDVEPEKGGININRYNRRFVVLDCEKVRYIKITLEEDNTKYHWSIGELFVYEKGQVLKQVQDLSSVLEKAIEHEKGDEIKEAVSEYLRVISFFPDLEEAHLRLGNIYASSGVTDTPSFSRGKVFERLGMIDKAMRDYDMILQSDSWSRNQLLYLSGFYQSIGTKEKVELIEKELSEGFEPKTKMDIKYGGAIRLLGIGMDPQKAKRGEKVRIVYYWEALKRMDKDYAIFAHFKNDGRIVFQNDHYPLSGGYQTSKWEKGDIIRESYDILVPEDAERGVYNLTIGIWNPEDERRLKIRKNIFKSIKEFSIEKVLEVMD